MKKIISAILVVVTTVVITTFFLRDTFSLKNIEYKGKLEEQFTSPPLNQNEKLELEAILQQSFHYLGKGHQSYAFLSENKRYVLKFFKFTYLKDSWFLSKKQEQTRQMKLKRMFIGYQIAFEKDRDNTGILYVHLSKSRDLKKHITVIDSFGLSHTVDLDQVFFIIQKKAILTRRVLKDLLSRGDVETFKKRIDQLFELYISEYKRGLFDSDHNIMSNTGFLPTQAIRIDVGRLTERPEIQKPEIHLKDLRKIISKRIDKWLKINYPQDYDELHEYIECKLTAVNLTLSSSEGALMELPSPEMPLFED